MKSRPDPSPRPPGELKTWLDTLRDRGVQLTVNGGAVGFTGPATVQDLAAATRYRHALTIAAAGTHPTWWRHAAGLDPTLPGAADLPLVACPATAAGHAYPCATCGQPAPWLDAQILGWCDKHVPPSLLADTWQATA